MTKHQPATPLLWKCCAHSYCTTWTQNSHGYCNGHAPEEMARLRALAERYDTARALLRSLGEID